MSPLERLRQDVLAGTVEEVVVALPDLQGRLQGLRVDARRFLDEIAHDGVGACVYLLSVDVTMTSGPGYGLDADAHGYGDLLLRPDPATLRPLPWDPGSALVIADAVGPDGAEVAVAPRTVLRRQLERLAGHGLHALAGVELEFVVHAVSYAQAHARGYRDLPPATRWNSDYALTGLEGVEPLARTIRRAMRAAGLRLDSARGECRPGQYEIVFRYDDALAAADQAVFYRTGAKQIAGQEGLALTFMAKPGDGEGNSGHLHVSVRDAEDRPVFADAADPARMSPLMARFVAGQLACLREFALLQAPNVNSWKRLQPGAFAPTAVAWGRDNRLCPVRVVGTGSSLRIEHRVPGADANPYLSLAAVIAAGLHGIEHDLDPGDGVRGAPGPEHPRLPGSLAEAADLWEGSAAAQAAFGPEVVAHLATAARTELAAFSRAVTDWELQRGYERL